ncbi:YigZ family protein [Photobacterium damselae]|uniref:YigZ family protein n=1 Tax=Photobacterium damselae TaxID=38293 RepID=UPI000A2FAAF7|nr:YigZ family protein [Photobacterium damselae]ARR50524.1 YigZ family protein [Photobacterium damselae subsp. damselae]EJN6961440.1 YigZ family protein [Photobacterium damselae]MCG3846909.1 YigZ family protein [Photobacterium damselae]MCG9780027.1 YigZ family protein [Photobacterium damselae]NVO74692.1 YigZ family protein [Photobacterium damselae subsp. damselae]
MNSEPYWVPADAVVFEEEIKKSRFITYLAHTPNIEAAKAFVNHIKEKHHDARHNCWAFVAGRPTDSMKWGFSDDGEPSGTAGKPILAQLTGSNVGEITAVVTRYYGGIRLGTGGLVKAYGGGVQQALAQLITQEKVMTAIVTLCCDYNQVSLVESLLNEHGGVQLTADYQTQVSMTLELDQREVSAFCAKLVNRSGGRIQPVTAD